MKKIKEESGGLRKKGIGVEREVINRATSYVVAAFGFVAGLAWNDFAKSVIEYVFPLKADSILAKALYAVLVTLFVVLLVTYFSKITAKEK